jgi:branched-chain amino acid transport system ATP-binding protein
MSLELDDARIHFGGVKAVDGVSFRLDPGGLYGVVGPNGSGKTTLVNGISGVVRLTGGRIRFEGRDLTSAGPERASRAGVARTFQSIRLLPTLSVRDNVLLATDWHRDRRSGPFVRWARGGAAPGPDVDETLERLGLAAVADARPDELPYGVQRRVEIARALASDPRLLLLDEPLAGMSRHERNQIASLIAELRARRMTMLLIEHDLRTLVRICDELLVMKFGRLIARGAPRATVGLPEVQEAYLGRRHAAA